MKDNNKILYGIDSQMVTISETPDRHQVSKTNWKSIKDMGGKSEKCMWRQKISHKTIETTLRYWGARSQWKLVSRWANST